MSEHEDRQFLELYQRYRYEDQRSFYERRHEEFAEAQKQAKFLSIGLMFTACLAGAFEQIEVPWLKLTCLWVAAICPILSTAIAAYSTLYAFEQQAKLYQDTHNNLQRVRVLLTDLRPGDNDFAAHFDNYVQKVENIFIAEQGQWGQLAKNMKQADT